MKFIFLAPRFHTNQNSWVKSMINNGHEVEFNVLFKGKTENYSLLDPIVFSQCKLSKIITSLFGDGGVNLVRGFPNPFYYYFYLRDSNANYIIVRDIGRWFSFLGALCARVLGIKIIIYSQTTLHKNYTASRKLVMDIVIKFFRAKWITPIFGDINKSKNMPSNLYFVPFAVEDTYHHRNIETKKSINILSIGKFELRKNHLMLIKVIESLLKVNNNLNLTIIGEVSSNNHWEYFRKCEDFIDENNLSSNIKIFKNIKNTKIKKFYLENDVFILPSTGEPAAITPIEALGFGLPSICSNTNGTRFYIDDGVTGIIFEDNSCSSLKNAVKRITIPRELVRLKKNITSEIKESISMNNFYTKFTGILDEK